MSELREISGANVRLTPDQIRPPEGYVGFFRLFETPEQRDDMSGSPLLTELSPDAIRHFPYVRIPEAFLSGTNLLQHEHELEEYPQDPNLAVVRRQIRSQIEQRLVALGWRKQHRVLPSLWYSGNSEPVQVAYLAQRVEDVGLKQVIRFYELGPGIYEPTIAQAPQPRFLKTIHYDTDRLNRALDVQRFNYRNSDHPQNAGAAWVAQFRASGAFTSVNDRDGQWVLRKDVTAVRKYLYARFGAFLDLRAGWIVVPSQERNGEIVGTKGKHIKEMCAILRASNVSMSRLEIQEDSPSYQRLHETYTSEGWISEHLERMAKEGYAAYPETTAHDIPGFDEILHNLSIGQADMLAQNPNLRETTRSYPYANYIHERSDPRESITFTEETEMPESARQPGTWMQIETSSGSVYTFQVLTPWSHGIRVIGTCRRQKERDGSPFVGLLSNPMQGEPLSFSEFASIDPRNARETMRALHYEEKYSLESSAIRLMLEHYARYGEQWGIHPLNPSVITDGCLLKRETTPVAHIRIGHFEE